MKVEPSEGLATIWCKGAQDAMKLAGLMQKSYFMGRKACALASLKKLTSPRKSEGWKMKMGALKRGYMAVFGGV